MLRDVCGGDSDKLAQLVDAVLDAAAVTGQSQDEGPGAPACHLDDHQGRLQHERESHRLETEEEEIRAGAAFGSVEGDLLRL